MSELEKEKRGLYTGSIGYIGFDGNSDWNIVIRSIFVRNETAYLQVGGGITHLAKKESEYKETLNKAQSQLIALRTLNRKK